MKKEMLQLHAEFCKIFSNSRRLEIFCLLREGELNVNEIAKKLGISKESTSQQLALEIIAIPYFEPNNDPGPQRS